MSKKLTIDEIKEKVHSIDNKYIVMSNEYINNHTNLEFMHNDPNCLKYGKSFKMSYKAFLHGQRCPYCRYKRVSEKNRCSIDEIQKRVKLIDPSYTIIEYTGYSKPAKFKHQCSKKHYEYFYTTPSHFFSMGIRCHKCSLENRRRKRMASAEYYQEKINAIDDSFYVYPDSYDGCMKKSKILHKLCGNIFEQTMDVFIDSVHCPICDAKKKDEELLNVIEKAKAHNVLIKTNKKGSELRNYSLLECECLICHSKYKLPYEKLKCDYIALCPCCNRYTNEAAIYEFLINHGISLERQKTFDNCLSDKGSKLKFDFYIADLNLLIEYDGEFHYLPIFGEELLKKQQRRDFLKTEYCEKNRINLLRIAYLEQDNIPLILSNITKMPKEYILDYNKKIRSIINKS